MRKIDVNAFDMLSVLSGSVVAHSGAGTATIGRMNHCTGSAYTLALPAVSGNTGKFLGVTVATTGLLTIDGNSSELIDGSLTRIMWSGESAILLCDGTGWKKVGGRSRAFNCAMNRTSNITSITTGTQADVALNGVITDPSGLMGDTTNNRINVPRPGEYTVSGVVRWNAIATAAGILHAILLLNGVQIGGNEVYGPVASLPSPLFAHSITLAAGDNLKLRYLNATANTQSILGQASYYTYLTLIEHPTW